MKPLDLSKFKKETTKTIPGISSGFKDLDTWVSTGNYTLNYLMSYDFNRGIALGVASMFAGDSGSGKSYIASGNIVKNAQEQNILVVLIDTEGALTEKWLNDLGVDTDPSKLHKVDARMVDDVAKFLNTFFDDITAQYDGVPLEERQKVLIVLDSLGFLLTNTEHEQFKKGDLKGDMGRKAKALKLLMANVVGKIQALNIGLVVTNHVYANQAMYASEPVIVSGGSGFEYGSSVIACLQKRKLKEEDDNSSGKKSKDVVGIRCAASISKTRFGKPFEKVVVDIPYEAGMDPYSGLIDLFEDKEIFVKEGNRLKYVALDGTEYKEFRKNISHDLLDLMMKEFYEQIENIRLTKKLLDE